MTGSDANSPAEKLAALSERLKGPALLALLNVKNKPAPEALVQRVNELRDVVFGLCAHLPEQDPVRATALERLKGVEALLVDPLELQILVRAQELRQDASDPAVHAMIESAFYEDHVPRTVWQSVPPESGQNELRRSMRLPILYDVDLDVGGGKRVRCQTLNLSRDGVCLDVPADFSSNAVTMLMSLAATGQQITVGGDVVWREPGRVGVAFKIGVAEQNALDGALQAHFASLSRTCDRWKEVAPKSGAAIACGAIVGYASSALPSARRDHYERLMAAAQADPTSKDLQLAVAKLAIEERDYETAQRALKRVVINDRNDLRYVVLDKTLAHRLAQGGRGLRGAIARAASGAKIPLAALAGVSVVVAVVVLAITMRGPFESVSVPPDGFRCDSLSVLEAEAVCVMDAAKYRAITDQKERWRLALMTLQPYRERGVHVLTIDGRTDEDGVLDFYDVDDPLPPPPPPRAHPSSPPSPPPAPPPPAK